MFTSDTIWGIDIGDSCIKAVKLKKSKGSVAVEDYGYIELDIELKDKEGPLVSIQDGLERLASRKVFAKSEVCISLSAKNVNNRFISVPLKSKEKQMDLAIEKEAKRQIPFPLEEVQWGYYRLPDRDDQAQVALFAARNEQIEELLDVVNDAGLSVRGIQVPGLALYNFIDWTSEIDEHLVVLDFGEKTTDLIVVHDGAVWLRSLPLSGSHITQLLEKKFRITTAEANTLKHEMERSSQKEKLFRVIEPKLKDLVVEIKRSINFRKTQVKDLQPTRFLACGGSSQLPGVARYFTKQLRLDAFKLNLEELDFSNCPDAQDLEDNIISYGVAFGLALQGLEETEVDINLIPSKFVIRQTFRSKRILAAVANVVFLIMVLMMFLSGNGQIDKLTEVDDKLKKLHRQLKQKIELYDKKKAELPAVHQKAGFYVDINNGKDFVPKIYDTVMKALDSVNDVYLVDFSVSKFRPEHFYRDGQKELTEEVETAPRGAPAGGQPAGRGRGGRGGGGGGRGRGATAAVPPGALLEDFGALDQVRSEDEGVVVLKVSCVGINSSATTKFQTKLLESKIFSEFPPKRFPGKIKASKGDYNWRFNPAIDIDNDPFKDVPPVQDLRKEKGWDFGSQEIKINEIKGHELKMEIVVNLKSYFKEIVVENPDDEEED